MNKSEASLKGGLANGLKSHKEAIERYNSNPNYCKQCNLKIEIIDDSLAKTKYKIFCNQSCAATYNNVRKIRQKKIKAAVVRKKKLLLCSCGNEFWGYRGKFCLDCRHSISVNLGKINRAKQLEHEVKEAEELEENGYKIYSPTVVCDRIAIKDGKVYFIEFKFKGQELREGQKDIQTLVPDMYIIKYSD